MLFYIFYIRIIAQSQKKTAVISHQAFSTSAVIPGQHLAHLSVPHVLSLPSLFKTFPTHFVVINQLLASHFAQILTLLQSGGMWLFMLHKWINTSWVKEADVRVETDLLHVKHLLTLLRRILSLITLCQFPVWASLFRLVSDVYASENLHCGSLWWGKERCALF